MKPMFVTITGVDDRTDLRQLADISRRYPVEWGFLFAPQLQGCHPRYPSFEKVVGMILHQWELGLRTAAHLCGGYAKAIMNGTFDREALPLGAFSRIQVNHVRPDADRLKAFAREGQPVIAQWRDSSSFPACDDGILRLYDMSGGRGVASTEWPANPGPAPVGYAGGLGPDNIAAVNAIVGPLSPSGYWLDMETGVRTDDWLDLSLVEKVLAAVYD